MTNRTIVDLGRVRMILAELDKARTAVLSSDFQAFHHATMRAILLTSAAKMAEEEPPAFAASRM